MIHKLGLLFTIPISLQYLLKYLYVNIYNPLRLAMYVNLYYSFQYLFTLNFEISSGAYSALRFIINSMT